MEDLVKKADELQESGAPAKEVYDLLQGGVKENPESVELLWRLCRAHFDMADTKPNDKEWRKQYLMEGHKIAEKALALDENHWAAHKWFAIMTSSIGDFLGNKEKIANAYKIKDHALKADELKPKDPSTLHLLGRWCFGVANISWIERGIASTLFGTPPSSSFDEALKYFLAAYEVEPKMRRNLMFIGDCYVLLKDKAKAKEFFQKLIDLPAESELDKTLAKEAQDKIKKC